MPRKKTYTSSRTKKSNRSKKLDATKIYGKKAKKPKKKFRNIFRRFFRLLLIVFFLFIGIWIIGNAMEFIENANKVEYDLSETNFIEKIEPIAIREYRRSGILPSVTIGQAILESNWGKSKLSTDANNLFGIKVSSGWRGNSITLPTKEHYNQSINAEFRSYRSWEESVVDHTDFLINNKRYGRYGLFSAKDYKTQAQALENAGYATSKNKNGELIYADLLISVIEKNHLYDIDKKVMKVE